MDALHFYSCMTQEMQKSDIYRLIPASIIQSNGSLSYVLQWIALIICPLMNLEGFHRKLIPSTLLHSSFHRHLLSLRRTFAKLPMMQTSPPLVGLLSIPRLYKVVVLSYVPKSLQPSKNQKIMHRRLHLRWLHHVIFGMLVFELAIPVSTHS